MCPRNTSWWMNLDRDIFQKKGGNDQRGISVTLSQTIIRKILAFQLIYTRKTKWSLPLVEFADGFCLSYNLKH